MKPPRMWFWDVYEQKWIEVVWTLGNQTQSHAISQHLHGNLGAPQPAYHKGEKPTYKKVATCRAVQKGQGFYL